MRHLPIIASRTPAFAGLTESTDGSTSGGSINRLLRRSAAYNLFRLPSTFLQCPAEPTRVRAPPDTPYDERYREAD